MTELTGTPDPAGWLTDSRRRAIFLVTALGAFMGSLDLSIVNVAFPALERAFSHDARASLAWIITGYSIVFGSLLVIAGRSADRLGARKVFFAGLLVFCVGSLSCALAPTVALLISIATPSLRATARPDYPGAAILSVALASLVLAISEGPTWGWSSPWVLVSFVAACVLLTLFIVRSSRHEQPVLDLTLFRARSFRLANTAAFLYSMGFFAMLLGNILFLTSVWHFSILDAGLAVTPGPLVVAAVSGPAGKIASRYGFRPVLLVGFVTFAAGVLWYVWRVHLSAHYLTLWLPGTLIVGLGIGLTFPVLSAAAVSSLQRERFAVGSAVNQTARQIGGALGVALLVVLLGAPTSARAALANFHHLWLFIASMALAAGVVCLGLGRAAVPAPNDADAGVARSHALEEVLDGEIVVPLHHRRARG
ncbi:MAG: MFS transporter [Acidimicrobiales bacterium]